MSVTADGDGWRVRLPDGSDREIHAERTGDHLLRIRTGDRFLRVPLLRVDGMLEVCWRGRTYRFWEGGSPAGPDRAGAESGRMVAPITGAVVQVHAGVGDQVTAYQTLLTIEAMKVLVTVEAPFDGVLSALHAGKGDRVEMGAVVAEVTPAEQSE